MKQFITALAFTAMTSMSLAAAECPYDITWYQGSEFSYKVPMNNRTASAIKTVYGMFPDGTKIVVDEDKRVSVSGPENFTRSAFIGQPGVLGYDANGNYVKTLQPGFSVSFTSEVSPVKTPGVYTLTVPAGCFTVNDDPNPEFDVEFAIEDTRVFNPVALEITPDPLDGTSAESFGSFAVSFSNKDADDKRIYTNLGVKYGSKVTVTDKATNEQYQFDIKSVSAGTSILKYQAQCEPVLDKGGTYEVVWPAGFMQLNTDKNSTIEYFTNEELRYTYTCTGAGGNTPVVDQIVWCEGDSYATRTPIVDNTVIMLGTVFGVLDGKTVKVTYSEQPMATVTGPDDFSKECPVREVKMLDPISQEIVDAPAFKILIGQAPDYVKKAGVYHISVPAGAFQIDGQRNAAFTYDITVKDTRNYQPIDLPIDRVLPTPDGTTPTTETTLEKVIINISNPLIEPENASAYREFRAIGVNTEKMVTITTPDGASNNFKLVNIGTNNYNLRYIVSGDYGYTAAGRYTVTFPEGIILLGSGNDPNVYYTNKTLTYNYTLSGTAEIDLKLTVNPADKNLQALAGIEVFSPDEYWFELDNETEITLTLPGGEKRTMNSMLSANALYLNLFCGTEIFTAAGDYTLEIPAGALTFCSDDQKIKSTKSYSMTYTVSGGTEGDLSCKISDKNGEVSDKGFNTYSLQRFYFKFDKDVTPTPRVISKVTYPDKTEKYIVTTWSSAEQRFMLDLNYPTAKGEYTVEFPAGAAFADGVYNKEIKFTVNFISKEAEDLTVSSDPASGKTVIELLNIYVDASEEIYTSIAPYNSGITMTYFSNDDKTGEKPQMQYLKTFENPLRLGIVLDAPVTEAGDYTWTIPAESILAVKKDGTQVLSREIKFFWSIRTAGVTDNICEGDATVTVYDMNGVCLIKEGSREELGRLAKGVYIINGRTFILK